MRRFSFLPVFALGGMEGKMFQPLAFTKSFALMTAAVLATTLVPALCTIFIRGRLRSEEQNWLVRSVVEVYRPVLDYGGWGIRRGRDGERVLNARGDRGVRLHHFDGSKILIGSQRAEELALAVEGALRPGH